MTETRLKELQTETARLKQIDKETTERVADEFFERDIAEYHKALGAAFSAMGSFDENGDELGSAMAWTQEDVNDNLIIECSAELDIAMANESENLQ